MTFCENLKAIRKQADMRLDDVSNLSGISVSQLSRFENGNRRPRADELLKLADIFSVEVSAIAPSLGQKIKTLREEKGMTQNDLARAAGVSQPLITTIEKGEQKTSKMLPSIAKAIGVNACDLDEAYSTAPANTSSADDLIWVCGFISNLNHDEVQRMKALLTVAFPNVEV